ncbi:MAG: Na+ dependent nucleoside transporter N-terminal domain-containing protein, partial [Verrucomicrobiota bacterium]
MNLHFVSLIGWPAMLLLASAISYNRKKFPWRTVLWGLGLQFTLALLILKTPWGGVLFEFAGKVIQKLVQFSGEGTRFVFGPLADGELLAEKFGPGNSVVFAILITGTVVIVAALSSWFY